MSRPTRGFGQGASRWLGARPSPGATTLLVVEVGAFLLLMMANAPSSVTEHLALVPRRAIGPEPWQIVTNGLIHLRLAPILFNALGLWWFGTPVEERAGRWRMIATFVAAQLVGS